MTKDKTERPLPAGETSPSKRLALLALMIIVIGLSAYVGVTMLGSLKTPDHSHAGDDNPDQRREMNQAEIVRLQKVLGMEPNDISVMTQLGDLLLKEERYTLAADVFARASALEQNNVHALTGLGNAYRLSGRTDEGLALLRKSIAIDSTFAESWLLLGVVYRFEKNEPEYARWAWQKFLSLEPAGENADLVRKELKTIASE